jgi:hypothetical protein
MLYKEEEEEKGKERKNSITKEMYQHWKYMD